ncbi:uncharacterized protein KY384_001929 [Bacidia gigantensis]|uniref:uncharacterized protein n=1 Tax=Bacidia gigantensis TaxID=2732470 RepID=UPI001D03CDBB|nr:uncharacterized protein KY384_001929 [Bacidia gigantensis]KAG8533146.1 hypothetical protein KY384_001929 [Bacidia gigantensis]
MRLTTDPRIRQTLNQISENIENANQKTQASLFTLSDSYIQPCLSSLQPCWLSCQTCLEASCQPCFTVRDDARRHRQPRYLKRGRERAAFDFYDDWDEDEEEWGNDELDALLNGSDPQQPGRRAGMSYGYGTRGARRKSVGAKDTMADDPTLLPQSSIFGFLERLPWRIGGRGTRYRPNPANLQVNVGKKGREAEPLMAEEEDNDDGGTSRGKHARNRSATVGSRETNTSLSSRGDIFPSDDEGDAREIDDEFALRLGRRSTGATSDERSSKKKPADSRNSIKTSASGDTGVSKQGVRAASASSERLTTMHSPTNEDIPTLADLKREEEDMQKAEEGQLQQRRTAAQRLASERGLSSPSSPVEQDSKEASIIETSSLHKENDATPVRNDQGPTQTTKDDPYTQEPT